jgi:hypothetical protein
LGDRKAFFAILGFLALKICLPGTPDFTPVIPLINPASREKHFFRVSNQIGYGKLPYPCPLITVAGHNFILYEKTR